MSSDFNFTVTSWFIENVHIKPYFNTRYPPPRVFRPAYGPEQFFKAKMPNYFLQLLSAYKKMVVNYYICAQNLRRLRGFNYYMFRCWKELLVVWCHEQDMKLMNYVYLLDAATSSGILKAKQKLGVTFNSDKLGGIDFTKFSKLSMWSAGAGRCWLVQWPGLPPSVTASNIYI